MREIFVVDLNVKLNKYILFRVLCRKVYMKTSNYTRLTLITTRDAVDHITAITSRQFKEN
jgi:hypothetical protein